MKNALRGALVIGAATLIEALRSRILLVSLFFALVLVGLSVTAASISFGEQSRLIIDVGLATASALGSLIAVSLAVVSFASELTRRTAYPLLARPIPRGAFVAGKYLGIVAAMELVVLLMGLATAMTVWLYGDTVPAAFWASLWLTGVEILVVVALALMFSSMTVPVLAATYTISVLIVGNLAGDVLRHALRLEKDGVLFGSVLHGFYFIFPDLEKLCLRSQAANSLPVPADFVATGSAYGLTYACAALLLAIIIFSRREAI